MQNELKTIGRLLLHRVEESAKDKAIGWIEVQEVKSLSFLSYKESIERLCLALIKEKVTIGSKVAILAQTSKEWHLLDLAIQCARGVVVPIYHSYKGNEILHILHHSEASTLIVEDDAQLEKILPLLDKLDKLKLIISLTPLKSENLKKFRNAISYLNFKDLEKIGLDEVRSNPDKFEMTINSQSSDEVASIIYTSGTTGEPKGAVITHLAFVSMLENIKSFMKGGFSNKDRTLTFLPLSHVLGRCDSLLPLIFGWEMVFAESIEKLINNITIVRPTVMLAVPRIFEKIYAKAMDKLEEESQLKKISFKLAISAAEKYFEKIDQDRTPSASEIIAYQLAYKLVFSKIYQLFGGRIRYFVSGGAPLSPKISGFLRFAGLTVLEGYGLTETIAPCTVNPLYRQVPGSVGQPIGDVEISFEKDGEILVKSQALFREYYQNPQATEEAFKDEWFRTGDIGHFTTEGYLKITDRKKDLIITSGGKNVAPQKIEGIMKNQKWISHFVCIGDQRKYLTGIVSLEKESFLSVFEELGLPSDCSIAAIAQHPKVREWVQESINLGNQQLASFETIKKFHIAREEFDTDNFLTPSLKIKRKLVNQNYAEHINALYEE